MIPETAISSLPTSVRLRCGMPARLERLEPGHPWPLVGRISLTGQIAVEKCGAYHLWDDDGRFAPELGDHELDIVAIVHADGSESIIGHEETTTAAGEIVEGA